MNTCVQIGVLVLAGAALLGVGGATGAARQMPAQAQARICLHEQGETTMQRERRLEALEAMRLVDEVFHRMVPFGRRNLQWEEFATTAPVISLLNDGTARGDLARRIQWGEVEPLPGWRMEWINRPGTMLRFSLTDVRDPCRFVLSSLDPNVLPQPELRLLPLDSTQ